MKTVSMNEFEAFVVANCPMHIVREPRKEMDNGYLYECFDDADGEEIAFITYKAGDDPIYSVKA